MSAGRGMLLQTASGLARIEGKAGEISVLRVLAIEKPGEKFLESIFQHGKSVDEVAELLPARRCIAPAAPQHPTIDRHIPQHAVAVNN